MQRALIVDDSKTAQLRLKKMMARYDLTVDVAFSAEEALGYLSYRMPAVIFMDHHMEGMDGFEALKIIKANPNTAMIPVIMYTAQKGDVYVGQARALGALDILSKEVIKPSNLERVLSSLKVYPKDSQRAVAVPVSATATAAAASLEPAPEDPSEPSEILSQPTPINSREQKQQEDPALSEVRTQVARLFELHIADVRQQISENSRQIVRRLTSEIEKAAEKEPTIGDVPLSVYTEELTGDKRRAGVISNSLLLLIIIGIGLLGYQLFDTRSQLEALNKNYQQVLDSNTQNQTLISNLSATLAEQIKSPQQGNVNAGVTAALSWALDANMQFPFNGQPLNEQTMLDISNLVYRLDSLGFEGIVELNIHFGNFCLKNTDSGDLVLADSITPAEKCIFSADSEQEYPVSNYLSIPYLNFQDNAVPVKEGLIDLNVLTVGTGQPRIPYPATPQGVTAGQWNEIAAKNNRVTVDFSLL
ncbi:response regulator receiver domain-containing protein [Alteromonadaceae bacterium 2753L.S.0a.02]|nr:response regulator receiver domain-containing protein [Alteromonadaceae bacterium 2753L.S.0a.02]